MSERVYNIRTLDGIVEMTLDEVVTASKQPKKLIQKRLVAHQRDLEALSLSAAESLKRSRAKHARVLGNELAEARTTRRNSAPTGLGKAYPKQGY